MALSADEILKKFHDVMEKMSQANENLLEKVDKVQADATQALDEMKAWKAENVSMTAPLDEVAAMYAQQRGGIFGGKFKLPMKKMLSFPASSGTLNGGEQERLKTIQDLHDANTLRYWAYAKKMRPGEDSASLMARMAETDDFKLYCNHLVAAGYAKGANDLLNPAAGTGANLDFTLLSAQLIDLMRLEALLPAQFTTMTLTRKTQEFPALRAGVKAVLGGGVGLPEDDATLLTVTPPAGAIKKPTFGQVQFSAVHCLGFIMYTDDMLEDSIVPLLPILRAQAVSMINDAKEDAIVNGDTTATHMDDDIATPNFAVAWDGMRKMADETEGTFDKGDAIISPLDANLMMRKMGKYAKKLSDLVWVMNITDWLILAADAELRTVDKAGDRATLRQGVVNQVSGVDIVLSAEIRRDLGLAGAHVGTPSLDVFATTVLFNRTRFWLAEKNQLDIEMVRVPQALGNWIQADLRVDFQAIDKNTGADFDTAFVTLNGGVPVVREIEIQTP